MKTKALLNIPIIEPGNRIALFATDIPKDEDLAAIYRIATNRLLKELSANYKQATLVIYTGNFESRRLAQVALNLGLKVELWVATESQLSKIIERDSYFSDIFDLSGGCNVFIEDEEEYFAHHDASLHEIVGKMIKDLVKGSDFVIVCRSGSSSYSYRHQVYGSARKNDKQVVLVNAPRVEVSIAQPN